MTKCRSITSSEVMIKSNKLKYILDRTLCNNVVSLNITMCRNFTTLK